MRINTITCHNVYNYGASLQAYALQRFLEMEGHDVHIINYMPKYLSFHYKVSLYFSKGEYSYKPSLKYWPVKILFAFYRYIRCIRFIPRKKSFDRFTKSYLNLTRVFRTNKEITKYTPQADIYIAGSDQIWNSKFMENGNDPVFYLTFVNNKKKISYAASFGATEINQDKSNLILSWLKALDSISVREQVGRELLSKYGINSDVVCDPVFLLNIEEWSKICVGQSYSKYLLIYNIGPLNDKLIDSAVKIARRNGMSVISVLDTYKIDKADANIENAGPLEFVTLIKNADFVVSNSFHATAFSIIFHRQFATYTFNNLNNSSRMVNILNVMKLVDRFELDVNKYFKPIDYNIVNSELERYRSYGINWLNNQIHNKV